MMLKSNKKVYSLGLENRTAGFDPKVDNLPPSPEKIVEYVLKLLIQKMKSNILITGSTGGLGSNLNTIMQIKAMN